MIDLKGKKILLFAPKWLGYEKEIYTKLENLGASVMYFDERPGNTFLTKALIRLNKRIIANRTYNYYKNILKLTNLVQYDYILIVNIEAMTSSVLMELRKQQPMAKFILYMWDSILNKKNTVELLKYFDRTFSFEKKDCLKINLLQFLPLFYSDNYKQNGTQLTKKTKYDFCFIGTIHSDRYTILKKLQQKQLKDAAWFLYMFFPSPLLFLRKKIIDSKFRSAKIKEFHFTPINQIRTRDYIFESKIIVDIQHPNQEGLTMRTIEAIGAQKKLITTNPNIVNYDFYDSNNIFILDRENPEISDEFISSQYVSLPIHIYNKYSIDSWILSIFSE
jgi:hypothetical protein